MYIVYRYKEKYLNLKMRQKKHFILDFSYVKSTIPFFKYKFFAIYAKYSGSVTNGLMCSINNLVRSMKN